MPTNNLEQSQKYFKKALNQMKSGDANAAESFYKRALHYNPRHLDANYLLGTLYAERGDLISALKFLQSAAEINPRSHMVQNNLGNIYQMTRRFDEAIVCYQRALTAEPNMPEVYNNLGNIYKNLEQFEEAEIYYRRAILLRPDFVACYCNLGGVLSKLKKFPEGIASFNRAIELLPNYKQAHEGLGVCYKEIGDKNKAIECFNRYLEIDPSGDSEVRLWLALLNSGDIPERYPAAAMITTYEKKAGNWDSDIRRPGMEFLGPKNVHEMLKKLKLPQQKNLDVLDVGCGTGVCGEYLRDFAILLVGVDLSPHMLEQADKKRLYDKLACAEAVSYMQQCKHSFDLVVASGVLILFGDLQPIFQATADLLKSGGVFVFTLYRSEGESIVVRHNLHFAHSKTYIINVAAAAGFEVTKLDEEVHEYESGEAQAGWLIALRKVA
jgi:predicted TPR repeat methyltransferase